MPKVPLIRPSRFNQDLDEPIIFPSTSQTEDLAVPALFVNPLPENQLNMNQQPVDYALVRMYIENIPKFNGENPQLLQKFIRAVDELFLAFPSENQTFKSFLLSSVKAKLIGQADLSISCRLELDTWNGLKQLLLELFGDGHTISSLQNKLIYLQQDSKLSTKLLGQEIMSILSNLVAKINEQNRPIEEKQAQVNIYSEMALETYTRCLPVQYKQLIRTRKITNITEAIQAVTVEEQFEESSRKSNQKVFLQKPRINVQRPNQFYQPTHALPNNNFQKFQPQQSNFQNFNRTQQPNFQNFNKTQQPIRQPYYNNVASTKQPTPTPMSGVSTIQSQQNRPFQQPFRPKTNDWYTRNVNKTGQNFQKLNLNHIEDSDPKFDDDNLEYTSLQDNTYPYTEPEYNVEQENFYENPDIVPYSTNQPNYSANSNENYLDENFQKIASENTQM
jgi:hypothetical protein